MIRNPAADQQALARVWRDGQKKTCFVYRLIATGTIEEKVFQRQTHKQSLSSCVVDAAEDVERHFSLDSLRKLFEMNEGTACETHDVFRCKRCVAGSMVKEGEMAYGDTSTWGHYSSSEFHKLYDPVLKSSIRDAASFVFQYKSHVVKSDIPSAQDTFKENMASSPERNGKDNEEEEDDEEMEGVYV